MQTKLFDELTLKKIEKEIKKKIVSSFFRSDNDELITKKEAKLILQINLHEFEKLVTEKKITEYHFMSNVKYNRNEVENLKNKIWKTINTDRDYLIVNYGKNFIEFISTNIETNVYYSISYCWKKFKNTNKINEGDFSLKKFSKGIKQSVNIIFGNNYEYITRLNSRKNNIKEFRIIEKQY